MVNQTFIPCFICNKEDIMQGIRTPNGKIICSECYRNVYYTNDKDKIVKYLKSKLTQKTGGKE